MDGQHRFRHHRAVHPVREPDRDVDHAPVAGLALDLPGLDQAEAAGGLLAAGLDVGHDPGAGEPLEGVAQAPVGIAGGLAVGGDQEVIGLQVQERGGLLARVHLRDQLRDAIDHHVLVVDRRQPLHRGRDLDAGAVVLVGQDPPVGPGREREDRVLHRSHVVFRDRIQHIADEEIRGRMALGQERPALGRARCRLLRSCGCRLRHGCSPPPAARTRAGRFRGFINAEATFVVSFTQGGFSWFRIQTVVVPESRDRGSGVAASWFWSRERVESAQFSK